MGIILISVHKTQGVNGHYFILFIEDRGAALATLCINLILNQIPILGRNLAPHGIEKANLPVRCKRIACHLNLASKWNHRRQRQVTNPNIHWFGQFNQSHIVRIFVPGLFFLIFLEDKDPTGLVGAIRSRIPILSWSGPNILGPLTPCSIVDIVSCCQDQVWAN